ncbi:MAG: tetratricopeptide repeat protein [Oceanicaulis sp.]|nr:tetratricopeptide repeat protein [Oceanicaulis sp.]
MSRRWTDLRALIAAALAALAAGAAAAQVPASVSVERSGATARLLITLPESAGGALSAEADVAAGAVLVARLSEAVTLDAGAVRDALPDIVAMARLDADGRTLRLALNRAVEPRVSVSHNVIALDLAAPGSPALAPVVSDYTRRRRAAQAASQAAAAAAARIAAQPPPPLAASVRIGEASDWSRLIFTWPEPVEWTVEQGAQETRLRFAREAEIDLADLLGSPPRFIQSVRRERDGGETFTLVFQLEDGATLRAWSDAPGELTVDAARPQSAATAALAALQAFAAANGAPSVPPAISAPEPAEPEADLQPDPERDFRPDPGPDPDPVESDMAAFDTPPVEVRADPVPEDGVVRVRVEPAPGGVVSLHFPWAALPGAAVFRRAGAIWIVFDAGAELDLSALDFSPSVRVRDARTVSGPDHTALRFETNAATLADVRAAGAGWTITLGDSLSEAPRPVRLARDTGAGRPAVLRMAVSGARSVVALDDPVVGDRLFVLTADGRMTGMPEERRFADAVILPSTHGVAIEPLSDGLSLVARPGGAELVRPGGLTLSRASDPGLRAGADAPVSPGFLDFERWRGDQPFLEGRRHHERQARAMDPESVLALARFLLAWELAPEAAGAVQLAVELRPEYETTPEIAAMNGAAAYMAGRLSEAERFFAHPALVSDPAARPWQGLLAAERGDWPRARRLFEEGRDALFFMDPLWRARISAAAANAALNSRDLAGAHAWIDRALSEPADPRARAETAFALAGLTAAEGDIDLALARYAALDDDPWTPIQARALLEKTCLEMAHDRISADAAAVQLEGLLYRWRGDEVEQAVAGMLGAAYAQAGRYEEAFAIMASAQARFPGSRVARQLGVDMQEEFRRLFEGERFDRMDPMQALALWYGHHELTPQGPSGHRIVRRIARRLVEIGLFDRAAQLLDHQLSPDVTMTSLARAQIAQELARVQLMDGNPEAALNAIERTRIAGLPPELVTARRLLQARALAGLNRADQALELISGDRSPEADRLRADIAWDARRWDEAGRRLEAVLGERWREASNLSDVEAHDVLRAALAYALAEERAGLERVEARYGAAMAESRHREAFALVSDSTGRSNDPRLSALASTLSDVGGSLAWRGGFGAGR